MGLYDKYILPRVIHLACSAKPHMQQRGKVVPLARGNVLEVGIGSGLNLPFYDCSKVEHVWGLEPSPEMRAMAQRAVQDVDFEVTVIGKPGEEIPLDDQTVDTVLVTYTLCSIPDVAGALRGMRRVLRPGGKLIFCEHGAAPDESVRHWQDRITPIWKKLSGGCHLNRPIPSLIEQAGFELESLKARYIFGWRPASFNYWGIATPN